MRFISLILLGFMAVGCGSSAENFVQTATASAPASGELNARALDSRGTPLPDVQIVLQERTTNVKIRTMSSADGSFQVELSNGVFDIGFESSDPSLATTFYGPVVVSGSIRRDFVLKDIEGRPADRLFGKIDSVAGVSAAGRLLSVRLAAQRGSVADALTESPISTATTGPDGTFEISLGVPGDTAFDVDIFDAEGALDEFVDLVKLQKACYVEFAVEESPVENLLRFDQAPPLRDQASPLRAQMTQASLKVDPRFMASMYTDGNYGRVALLDGGVFSVSSDENVMFPFVNSIIASGQIDSDLQYLIQGGGITGRSPRMTVNGDGILWYDYAVVIQTGFSKWWFTDKTGDTYRLTIDDPFNDLHKVSYNSSDPAIVKIEFTK